MNRDEAKQFKERWRIASEFTADESRRTPAAVKVRQLALMYEAARELGWLERLREGEEEVRERWRLLRERMNA